MVINHLRGEKIQAQLLNLLCVHLKGPHIDSNFPAGGEVRAAVHCTVSNLLNRKLTIYSGVFLA